MVEFFVVVGVLIALFISWLIISYTRYHIANSKKIDAIAQEIVNKADAENELQLKKMMVVARSVDDVVCRYNDLTVFRYVQTSDERTFIFESVAVEKAPEVYHADHPDHKYIIVDQCLLYREVPVE